MTPPDPAARETAISDNIVHAALNAFVESEGEDQWYHGLSGELYTDYLEGMRRALSVAHDAAEKRAEEMAARVKELEAALGEIAEAKAKTNAGTNIQLIWNLAAIARAALAQETP